MTAPNPNFPAFDVLACADARNGANQENRANVHLHPDIRHPNELAFGCRKCNDTGWVQQYNGDRDWMTFYDRERCPICTYEPTTEYRPSDELLVDIHDYKVAANAYAAGLVEPFPDEFRIGQLAVALIRARSAQDGMGGVAEGAFSTGYMNDGFRWADRRIFYRYRAQYERAKAIIEACEAGTFVEDLPQ